MVFLCPLLFTARLSQPEQQQQAAVLRCPTCPRSEDSELLRVTTHRQKSQTSSPVLRLHHQWRLHPPTGHSSLTLSVGLGDMRKSNMTMFWSDIRDVICIATRSNVGPPLCLFYFDTGSQKEFKCLNHQLHSFSLGGGSVTHSQSVGEKNSQLHADRLLLPW